MIKKYTPPITMLIVGVAIGILIVNFDITQFKDFASVWGSLILSTTLIIVTIYYAWQTRQSVKIMEDSSLPYVSVHLDNKPSHITDVYLVVRNDGNQSAFNVRLGILSGDINVAKAFAHNGKLSEMLFMKSTLAVLSPKSERRHLIMMTTPTTWKSIENVRTTIRVTYDDKQGVEYSYDYSLDYASLPFSGESRDSTYQKYEKSLQSIDKSLQEIAKK